VSELTWEQAISTTSGDRSADEHVPPAHTRAQTHRGETHQADRGSATAFASTALGYGLTIFPAVTRELSYWRSRAEEIPDTTLRRLALGSLAKRGNMEGAALFAALAPRSRRKEAVRALVAFQAAYNYLDLLAEQPSEHPVRNGRELHRWLLLALDHSAADYSRCTSCRQREDRYLAELVETTRSALAALPSFARVSSSAAAVTARIVEFQSLNLGERQGASDGLERWAREQNAQGSGLRWWELAAAAGSSLGVHVLIGLAARPELDAEEIAAVGKAYHPWIGALHSLLDSLVDVEEDRRERQRNLLGYYATTDEAAERLRRLTERAISQVRVLPRARQHATILRAMAGYYLSARTAREPEVLPIARAVVDGGGAFLGRTLPLFRAARMTSGIVRAAG
jgi:tetraprenyl-beta-curcumene synthase